jgi:hypothetical protein
LELSRFSVRAVDLFGAFLLKKGLISIDGSFLDKIGCKVPLSGGRAFIS